MLEYVWNVIVIVTSLWILNEAFDSLTAVLSEKKTPSKDKIIWYVIFTMILMLHHVMGAILFLLTSLGLKG